MKGVKYKLGVLWSVAFLVSCEIDNYDAPNGGLFGRILDEETGETVQQAVPSDLGLRLRFYETGKENSMEQHFYVRQDGSFENSRIFNGPIRIVLEQRNFFPIDTLDVLIQGQTRQDIPVIPYTRIHLERLEGEEKIKIHFSISRSERQTYEKHKITQYRLLWNVSPYLDSQKENYCGRIEYSLTGVSDEQVLDTHYSVELDLSTAANRELLKSRAHLIKGNGHLIYLRLCVSTTSEETDNGNYINYSEVFPVQISPNLLP
ncbi:MAG: DUF3823 domain-containing protein [Dysgonamonadaceae bacterium]|jgi:hypothetical protein|nr:DUF3823 domain-containing protein [Dysgonamonadaceae bacterium]